MGTNPNGLSKVASFFWLGYHTSRRECAAETMDPLDWLEESRLASLKTVYMSEVLRPVRAVAEGCAELMPVLSVSSEYL